MIFERDGARMHYTICGQGPALLLLHGWGCSIDIWKTVLRDFAGEHTLVAVDFPGHGESPEPPAPWSVTEYMELVRALLDELHLGRVDVLAHSFGGRVALLLAAEHPEYINRMVLTGCAGLPNRPSGKKSRRAREYQLLKKLVLGPVGKLVGAQKRDALLEKLVQKYGSEDYKVLTPSMRATFNRVIGQDLTWCLDKIRASTLLVWGEKDTATPIWMGEIMEKTIADAGLVRFADCGHYAFLERYGDFQVIARRFLEG